MTKKAEERVKYTLATHAAEKLTPSREAIRLCEQIADGSISADSAVEQLRRNYTAERASANA